MIRVIADVVVKPVHFGQSDGFMEYHLGQGCVDAEPGIPRAPVWPVKATAQRMRVAEGRVNDPVMRHAKDQFVGADAGQQVRLRQKPVVGGIVQIKDHREGCIVGCQTGQHRVVGDRIARRDQPNRIKLSQVR